MQHWPLPRLPWHPRAVTPAQCKAARTLLGWNTRQLAERALVAQNTVLRFEQGAERMQARTVYQLQRTLEDSGIEFFGDESTALKDASPAEIKLNDGTGVRIGSPKD